MIKCQVRDLEVRGSNPGPGSNFALDINNEVYQLFIDFEKAYNSIKS